MPFTPTSFRGMPPTQGRGEYDRAIQDFDQALRLQPERCRGLQPGLPTLIAKVSMTAPFKTSTRLSGLIRTMPRLRNRGNAYRRKGEYDRAIRDFDQALSRSPPTLLPKAYYAGRGLAYAEQRASMTAPFADFDQALHLAPNDAYFAYYQPGTGLRAQRRARSR